MAAANPPSLSADTPANATALDYPQRVLLARQGDTAPALQWLRRQHDDPARPIPANLLSDHVVIASWAGLDSEVIALHVRYHTHMAWSPRLLGTVAKAYRNQAQWDDALSLYERALRAAPADQEPRLGLAMTLADAGRHAEALAQAQGLVQARPQDPQAWLALGYVHQASQSHYDAWAAYDKAYALAPDTPEALRGYVHALQAIGLAQPALSLAERHPDWLDAATMRTLQADVAANLVRLSALPARAESERYVIADRALQRYDTLLAEWQSQGDVPAADIRRLRIDRLGALYSRHAMQSVIQEYESLAADDPDLPGYALRLAAGAYLEQRQPEEASALFARALALTPADDPERLDSELGLYYAELESESFPAARQIIEQANQRDTHVRVLGQPEALANQEKLETQLAADMGMLYANDTDAAQQRLEDMTARAPYNQHLHTALASIYHARSWPRRAERRLKLAEALAPRNPMLMTEQGLTALTLQEWRQARLLTEDTHANYPEMQAVKRLKRRYDVYRKPELRITAQRGLSNDSPVSGDGDYQVDAVLYSPPIDENWRAFAGLGKAHGKFEEGRVDLNWQRAGLEWRGRDLTAQAEVSRNSYGHGARMGAGLSLAYDIDDHWQVGGEAALMSRNTPLRALGQSIRSNEASAYARWLASEQREWRLTLGGARFSDGNRRMRIAIDGSERLATWPRTRLDLLVGAEASRNSAQDRPYYNPASDLAVLPALRVTHILHRRYETQWEHALTAGLGSYTQRHYGTGAIAMVGYEHRYRANDTVEVAAGITTGSRPYDGVRERETSIHFELNIRF